MRKNDFFRKEIIILIGYGLILTGCSLNANTSDSTKEPPSSEESSYPDDIVTPESQSKTQTTEQDATESPKQDLKPAETKSPEQIQETQTPQVDKSEEQDANSKPAETKTPEQIQETQMPQVDENKRQDDNNTDSSVVGTVQLHDINYFDESILAFKEENIVDGQYIADDYYELVITNVTDTTFDFTVFKVNAETGAGETVFLTNTAVYTGDGTTAAFYGNDYTLLFSFPDTRGTYPVVTSIKVSGYSPIEGITFTNNSIPGYEFN